MSSSARTARSTAIVLSLLTSIADAAMQDGATSGTDRAPERRSSSFTTGIRLPDGAKSVTVPLLKAGGDYFVEVKINGRAAGLFHVDTGCTSSAIGRHLAAGWRLPVMGRRDVHLGGFYDFIEYEGRLVRVDSMSIGPVEVLTRRLVDMSLRERRRRAGHPLSGILGMDVLSQAPVTLDLAAGTMTFHDASAFSAPADAQPIDLVTGEVNGLDRGPRVRGEIDGIEALLLIDTGDQHAVHFNHQLAERHPRLLSGSVVRVSAGIGASGMPVDLEERLAVLAVFGQRLDRVHASLRPTRRLELHRDGALGTPVLRQFEMTFDVPGGRLWAVHRTPKPIAPGQPEGLDVNGTDLVGRTPLFTAIDDDDLEAVRALIGAGADVNVEDHVGNRPLLRASAWGNPAIVAALLEAGAAPDFCSPAGRSPLSAAAAQGRLSVVRQLLGAGADANRVLTAALEAGAADERTGATALYHAAAAGSLEVARELLAHGASVHAGDASPLRAAAKAADLELVRLLLAEGADPHARSQDGWTALHSAAESGSVEIAGLLLDLGAAVDARIRMGLKVDLDLGGTAIGSEVDLDALSRAAGGQAQAERRPLHLTPLMLAATRGHLAVVSRLLEAGAEVDAVDADGTSSLLMAAAAGHDDVARALLHAGADPDARDRRDGTTALMMGAFRLDADTFALMIEKGGDPLSANNKGQTTLTCAVVSGRRDGVIARLLAAGADVNHRTVDGHTALESAVLRGSVPVVEQLLAAGALLGPAVEGGATPLMIAAGNGRRSFTERAVGFALPAWNDASREIVALLLERGADANASNSEGHTPLSRAALSGHPEVVAALIDAGAAVNPPAGTVITPLARAAAMARADVVDLLLARGADVNAVSRGGVTALMGAAGSGDAGIVERLLEEGADVGAADERGLTALHVAVANGQPEPIGPLLSAGADVDAEADRGVTPLLLAVGIQHDEIARMLIDAGADVNARDTEGRTCRQIARSKRDALITQILADAGGR